MNIVKLISISALALAALSGCAHPPATPQTCRTEYDLTPPDSYEGKTCIMRCLKERTQCRDNKEQQYINCDHYNRMAALEFERCLASGATNCYSPTAPPCERPCSSTGACADECEMEYRQCYQSCGGKVVSRDVCTGGCDQGGICD